MRLDTTYKDIFISYRRDTGSVLANIIKTQVETKSTYSCFLDTENLKAGDFRKRLVPNIKYCDTLLVIITEKHLERCTIPNDVCVQELETALSYNKNIIVVTELQRKDVRKIINDHPNLPQSVKDLLKYNMFYMRPGDVTIETINKIIASIKESTLNTIDRAAKALSKSTHYPKPLSRIYICMYEFEYAGTRVGDYLCGMGKLTCRDNLDISIEGEFNCPTNCIAGDLKIVADGVQIFSGKLSKIHALTPLTITGDGVYKKSNNIYEGYIEEGKPTGYGILSTEFLGAKYTGFIKNGLKHGTGELSIKSKNFDCILYGNFSVGKPDGECLLVDNNHGVICRFNAIGNNIRGYATVYLKKSLRPRMKKTLNKNPIDTDNDIIYAVKYSHKYTVLEVTAEMNKKEILKIDYTVPEHLTITFRPIDGNIQEASLIARGSEFGTVLERLEVTTSNGGITISDEDLEKSQFATSNSELPWDYYILSKDQVDELTSIITGYFSQIDRLRPAIDGLANFIQIL
ncbi:TIR domain-containing protein [Clostridium tertium]|uniref:TIR domain-containing protein n=1 Tax=Clostridium tertium TaxID=1559 RepID=UPI0023B23958|nr:TIR domain-containing protein [Clostridium tertium]